MYNKEIKFLISFGKQLFAHFLSVTNVGDHLVLFVDKIFFDQLRDEVAIQQFIKVDEAKKIFSRVKTYAASIDSYVGLAIASYQVRIAVDVDTININSYYEKLFSFTSFKDGNEVMNKYFPYQEELWMRVKELFLSEKRFLCIPKQKTGSRRYVQYPLSQRIINPKDMISFADKFCKVFSPRDSYDINYFCEIMDFDIRFLSTENYDFGNPFIEECKKKLIYSFYLSWKGETTDDYIKHKKIKRIYDSAVQESRDITVSCDSKNFEVFYNNRKCVKSNYLFRDLHANGESLIPFLFDSQYGDWVKMRGVVYSFEENISFLIKKMSLFADDAIVNQYIKSKIGNCLPSPNDNIEYYFITFYANDFETKKDFIEIIKKIYPKLRCKEEITNIYMCGGLKLNRNIYAIKALPCLKINHVPHFIKIDTNEPLKISQKIIYLMDYNLSAGVHNIKVQGCRDIEINIADFPIATTNNITGWNINSSKILMEPIDAKENYTLNGLDTNLVNLEKTEREIIERNIRYSSRLNKLTEKEIRRKYGPAY